MAPTNRKSKRDRIFLTVQVLVGHGFEQLCPSYQKVHLPPAQAVYALDLEQIAPFQLAQEPPVLRTVEVLAALLVQEDVTVLHAMFMEGDQLPVFVLFAGADADVAVNACEITLSARISLLLLREASPSCFRQQ